MSAGRKRSRKPTTKSDPRARFAPNRLSSAFSAEQPTSKWVSDTKAVETGEGWFYLAVILDLFSRMAVVKRHPPAGLLHHCDRGSEFTSDRYLALEASLGIEGSMSRTATC